MKNHFAEGLNSTALEKFNEHVRRVPEKCSNGRGMLEYAAAQDFNPHDRESVCHEVRLQAEGMRPGPEVGSWMDHRNPEGSTKREY